MNLPDVWFAIIAVFWTGFFVLEGFDFGVGALHGVIGRTEAGRRTVINTIAPFWDGNEVWLVVGAAAIFAAFPAWYATWLSALYLGIVVLLLALIARGVAIEWRSKGRRHSWRGGWSLGLVVASLVAPFALGLALGDLVAGLPIDSDGAFTGRVWSLFTGLGVWMALTLVSLCLLHGATFLALRTTDELRQRATRWNRTLSVVALVMVAVSAVWIVLVAGPGWPAYLLLSAALISLVAAPFASRRGHDKGAFIASAIAMAGTVGSLFASLYPNVIVSSTQREYSLTVAETASSPYALSVMTVAAAIFFPLVLLYQGYTYRVLRKRVSGGSTQGSSTETPRPATPAH